MKAKKVTVAGMPLSIPEYYQQVNSMPDDPAGSVPFMVQTPNAICFMIAMAIRPEEAIPFDRQTAIRGIRTYLQDNQGIIEVNSGDGYVYSIVKTLKQPAGSGVQYCLTYQKIFDREHILTVQGFFEETGTTGERDNMVYGFCRSQGTVGSEKDPFEGWVSDPYDASFTKGARMNVSEREEYDANFPGFPLTMCREAVRIMIKGS